MTEFQVVSLTEFATAARVDLDAIPYSGRILIESLLRSGQGEAAYLAAQRLASGQDAAVEMAFRPARVLLQDFTGVPLLVDLAGVRDRVREQGGCPSSVNPAVLTDLVMDHSLQVDVAGQSDAETRNQALEFERNSERYAFVKWAQQAFSNLRVLTPGQGIVHQVNIERLARVVTLNAQTDGALLAYPDTVVGTDSHTPMVNGLGVLGWGVGGLEAEAIMLGLDYPIAVPPIVGVRLRGQVQPGVSATDVVLALTAHLRTHDVTGALVEFCGEGIDRLTAPDRCTVANMAPEYGAMAAYFPVDAETLRYLRQTGRDEAHVELVAHYCGQQHLLRTVQTAQPAFGRIIEFDLSSVETSLAGPSNPHQRFALDELPASFRTVCPSPRCSGAEVTDGDIVIAAITSCTSTSNPRAMLAAGVIARNAVRHGLRVPRHVKTSLAPGSRAVATYLASAGLLPDLETLGFHVVGYGCTTCDGGSGPLSPDIAEAIDRDDLSVAAVLSGNRNFQGRTHPAVKASYLASPAMVVALALVGHVRSDLRTDPIGTGPSGQPVYLADIWPSDAELAELEARCVVPDVFRATHLETPRWEAVRADSGALYNWREDSTYIRRPPYLDEQRVARGPIGALHNARALALLGDYISTDHISPVGAIAPDSPAGRYLTEHGVAVRAFNSYGARRGNHEVMMRGTFANPRLRNFALDDVEGGYALHLPSGETLTIFEAASRYSDAATPLIVLAGKGYGMGSSRDWAAKGPWLLGVRAVIAESFERIHRANLCAMGILPLTFPAGQGWASLGLGGREEYTLECIGNVRQTSQMRVCAQRADGSVVTFVAHVRVQSQGEWDVLLGGGMPAYLLRSFTH